MIHICDLSRQVDTTSSIAPAATGPTVYVYLFSMSSFGRALLLLLLLFDPDTDNSFDVATSASISRFIDSIIVHPLSIHDD